MVPYTFIENDRVTIVPTVDKIVSADARPHDGGMTRKGPAAPDFEVEDVLPTLTQQGDRVHRPARRRCQGGQAVLPLSAAGLAAHADRADEPMAGQERPQSLRRLRHADRRGHRPGARRARQARPGGKHAASSSPATTAARRRPSSRSCCRRATIRATSSAAHKADIYEGGHRIPFLVRWPGHVKAGTKSDQIDLPDRLHGHRVPKSSASSCPTMPAKTA